MISQQTHERIYAHRRRHNDWDFGYPWHKRLIRRIENINKVLWTGLLGKLLGVRPIPAPIDPQTIKSILFLRNDAIGDMVLTTPLWHEIRRQFPHIRIGVIGSIRNLGAITCDPNIDRRFDATSGDLRAQLRARKEIASEKWDIIMPMNYSRKTRTAILSKFLAPHSISSTLVRPGESAERRGKFFEIVVASPYRTEDIEMIEQMRLHLLGVLNMQIPEKDWRPFLFPKPEATQHVKERVEAILLADGTSRYIHVNLEARTAFREYGHTASMELSKRLLEEFPDATVLWTSSPQAAPPTENFLQEHATSRLHFFKTENLHELFAVVNGAALVVTPDTSVVHIASAFQRPIVALYPLRHEWPPYKTPNRLLIAEGQQPVSTIPVETVFAACKELLATAVPKMSAFSTTE